MTVFFIAFELQWQYDMSLYGDYQDSLFGQRVIFMLLFCWFLLDSYAHNYLMFYVIASLKC